MGVNFRKSINLGGGIKMNVGKKSVGFSAGVKGARIGVNSSGRVTRSASIPGTGISYRKSTTVGGKQKAKTDDFESGFLDGTEPDDQDAQRMVEFHARFEKRTSVTRVPSVLYKIFSVIFATLFLICALPLLSTIPGGEVGTSIALVIMAAICGVFFFAVRGGKAVSKYVYHDNVIGDDVDRDEAIKRFAMARIAAQAE